MSSVVVPDVATLRRMRADIGDREAKAYSDAELAAVLAEPGVDGVYNRAVEACLWRLLSNAALFDRYAGGASPDERTSVHEQLVRTYRLWRDSHRSAGSVPRVGQGAIRYGATTTESEF